MVELIEECGGASGGADGGVQYKSWWRRLRSVVESLVKLTMECVEVWWNALECHKVWSRIAKCGRMWWSVVECGGVWWSMVECG